VRKTLRDQLCALAAVTAASIALLPMPHLQAGQRPPQSSIPRESGAAGSPIFRPCDDIDAALARMNAGLGTQQAWLDSAERQLREAQTGQLESQEARRKFFRDALVEAAQNQIDQALSLRKKAQTLSAVGMGPAGRRKLLETVERINKVKEQGDELKKLATTAGESFNFGKAIRQNTTTLNGFLDYLDKSGLGEEGVSVLASFGGPAGKLAEESGKLGINFIYTMFSSKISKDELGRARRDLADLKDTFSRNRGIISGLEEERLAASCPSPNAETKAPSQMTASTPGSHLTPQRPETAAPAEPEKKKPSLGKAIVGTVSLAGATVAGLYAYQEYKALQELNVDTDTGSPSSGSGMTYVGNSSGGIQCTFNAGGVLSNCSATVTVNIRSSVSAGTRLRLMARNGNPGGNATATANPPGNMTFSLTGGTGSSSCPGPVTTLDLLDTSTQRVLATATGFSIPFTCR
jgi:hypothetical protein